MVAARWGRGEWSISVYGVSIRDDEKVLELDGGDGYYTTIWMYLMPLNCILKNGEDGKCYMHFATMEKDHFKFKHMLFLQLKKN